MHTSIHREIIKCETMQNKSSSELLLLKHYNINDILQVKVSALLYLYNIIYQNDLLALSFRVKREIFEICF